MQPGSQSFAKQVFGRAWLGRAVLLVLAAAAAAPRGIRAGEADLPRESAAPLTEPRGEAEIIAQINAHVRQGWSDAGIKPSKPADDGEWIRRLYLDVLGRIPRYEETTAFVAARGKDKRPQLVGRLLDSEEYAEDYVRNWSTLWTNALIGRTGGTNNNDLANREGLAHYLRRSLGANKRYDRLVAELITATGRNNPGDEQYNGAVNFLVDMLEGNAEQATAKTAQIFLGVQIQCTQCHQHPFIANWKQKQFWGLNSFFRQAKGLRKYNGRDVVSVRLVDEDFPGENNDPDEALIFYEERDGRLTAVEPTFIDGRTINPSGLADVVNRRAELARMVVTSELFPKAIVNRYWAHFLGYGFHVPFDDMNPENPPSHPELLEGLASDFAAHGYDLKKLIRWIVLSEPYGLSSSAAQNAADDPSAGTTPLFSRFYLRQMRAEELYESLVSAMRADETVAGTPEEQQRLKESWLRQFAVAFGTDDNDETTTFDGTIPQTLMMMNGELIQQATQCQPGSFLHRLAAGDQKFEAKLEFLYVTALARAPSSSELKAARALLEARGGDAAAALEDVWWAVLNSNEFILNH